MAAQKDYITVACVECGNTISRLSASLGIGTATCEICMRTAAGLPIPTREQYETQSDFLLQAGQMLGDESLIAQHTQQKVAIMIPETLFERLMGVVKEVTHFKRKQPSVPAGSRSSASVSKGKRRESLF